MPVSSGGGSSRPHHSKHHPKHHPKHHSKHQPKHQPKHQQKIPPLPSSHAASRLTAAAAAKLVPLPVPALLDDAVDRNLVTKFSYGLTPALAAEVTAAGGGDAWFARQLTPASIPDSVANAVTSWWPSLTMTPSAIWGRNNASVEYGWQLMENYQRWLLMRRMLTHRTVLEIMSEFWENHFNVPVNGDGVFTWRWRYGQAIRTYALGRFDQLLYAAVTHPAMLIYLGAAISTKDHPNENLGRELLELHTVGRGNYNEDDVKASARILTGWHVAEWTTWAASYRAADHYVGPVSVMGFSSPNSSANGRAVTASYLSYLAHHPATAHRIATKLATKFCSDTPSIGLVDLLATTYLANDTAIAPVLLALVASPEFQASEGLKVRDPCEDIVATYRALGVKIKTPIPGSIPDDHAVNAILWQATALGASPCNWPQPNGQPTDNDSWSSPSRMVASLGQHYSLSGRWWPVTGATYRAPAAWLPGPVCRLDELVEHLSQQILLQHAPPDLVTACCQATGYDPSELITARHDLVVWNFGRLLTTLLDSPNHMTR